MNVDLLATFEKWYRQEMPRLFNYISYRVRNRQDAEELMAAVCTKALDRLDQFDPERGALNAWIYGIARNEIKMFFRSHASRPVLIELGSLPEITVRETPTEKIVEQRELFALIVGYLPQLSERQQELIALRYGAGLTNQQIAKIMKMRSGYVRVEIHRALKKIRKLLPEEV